MKLVRNEEYKRLLNCQQIVQRLSEAHRWFSEFDDMLKPMWEYVFGKQESITLENGRVLFVYKNGHVDDARSRVRTAVYLAVDKRASQREPNPDVSGVPV